MGENRRRIFYLPVISCRINLYLLIAVLVSVKVSRPSSSLLHIVNSPLLNFDVACLTHTSEDLEQKQKEANFSMINEFGAKETNAFLVVQAMN